MAINNIGWGILGCGVIGPLHADAVQANKQAEHVRDLCEAIINDREPAIPGSEARKTVELIKAIYLSSRLGGSTVELPLSYEDDGPGIYPPQTWPEW